MFQCVKCGEYCDDFLFHSGKRKPTCKVCVSYRHYLRGYPEKALFSRYRVKWLAKYFDARMEARGWKRCARCLVIKPLSGKWTRNHCRGCHNERTREWKRQHRAPESRLKEYKKRNARRGAKTYGTRQAFHEARKEKGRIKRAMKEPADSHVSAYCSWLRGDAPDERVELHYEHMGKPWLNPRLSWTEKYRIQYRLDRQFQIKERLRRQFKKAEKRDGIAEKIRGAIRRGGESRTTSRLLGFTVGELCEHLEKQFTKGMTWDRFMAGEIHIDHIVPQAHFDLQDDEEWRQCWSLSNLRPCWARENLRKSAQRLFLL